MRAKRTHQMSIYETFAEHEIEPYPMWYEPEGWLYFQREMSLKRII